MKRPAPSLSWRIFIANAAVLCAAAAVLLLSPVTVSHPVDAREALVVVAGLCVMVLVNLWLVRRTLAPLIRLADQMDGIDLLRDQRAPRAAEPSSDVEIERLAASYDGMLARLREERRESARHAASAHEAERRRVARELHDQVGQVLTGLVLQVDRVLDDLGPRERDKLVPVRESARGALEDVRRVARSLRPDVLEELGLVPALQGLGTRFARDTGIRVERRLVAPQPPLDPDSDLALYRIAQEALTNVARHAGATHVDLVLEPGERHVTLTVRDDGRGLNGADPSAAGGLRWMRERAVLVGAELALSAPPEGGTAVTLRVPTGRSRS